MSSLRRGQRPRLVQDSHSPRLDGGRRTLLPRKRSCGRARGPHAARLPGVVVHVERRDARRGGSGLACGGAGLRRLRGLGAGSARHLGAPHRVGGALPLGARDRDVRAGGPRLGRTCRTALGVRAPRRRAGACDQLDGLLPERQMARLCQGAARAGHGRAADGRLRARWIRSPDAWVQQRHDRRGDRRVLEGLRRRHAPARAARAVPLRRLREARELRPRRAGACPRCSCGARTTSSRPWPARTASSASCPTRSWWLWTARATSSGRTRRPRAPRRSRASSPVFAR